MPLFADMGKPPFVLGGEGLRACLKIISFPIVNNLKRIAIARSVAHEKQHKNRLNKIKMKLQKFYAYDA